jgi:aminopeptidase N
VAELRAAAKRAKTRDDRLAALRALAGFDDARVLDEALDVLLTDDVQANEIRYVIGPALARRGSRDAAEAWVRRRWDAPRKKLPGSLGGTLVQGARVACSAAEVEARAAFYEPRAKEIDGAARRLAQALEGARLCASLRERAAPSFARALRGENEALPSRR